MWTLRRVPDKGGDVDLALVQTRRETNEKEKEDFAETVVTSVIQEQAVGFFSRRLTYTTIYRRGQCKVSPLESLRIIKAALEDVYLLYINPRIVNETLLKTLTSLTHVQSLLLVLSTVFFMSIRSVRSFRTSFNALYTQYKSTVHTVQQ